MRLQQALTQSKDITLPSLAENSITGLGYSIQLSAKAKALKLINDSERR